MVWRVGVVAWATGHKETNTKTSHCREKREAKEESGLFGAENVALFSGIVHVTVRH